MRGRGLFSAPLSMRGLVPSFLKAAPGAVRGTLVLEGRVEKEPGSQEWERAGGEVNVRMGAMRGGGGGRDEGGGGQEGGGTHMGMAEHDTKSRLVNEENEENESGTWTKACSDEKHLPHSHFQKFNPPATCAWQEGG